MLHIDSILSLPMHELFYNIYHLYLQTHIYLQQNHHLIYKHVHIKLYQNSTC